MLFYAVIPVTIVFTIWIPAHKWLTTRGTIYSDMFDILDVIRLARNVALIAPLVGIFLGTLMWCAIVGAKPRENQDASQRKPRRAWRSLALVLVGIVVGGSLGTRVGIWIHRNKMSPWESSQIAYAAAWYHYVSVLHSYLHGDCDAGREALLKHIQVLSRIRDQQLAYTGFLEPRAAIADTYFRLSLLEETAGNDNKADEYWDQAVSLLESAGWKDVNRRKILLTLKAIDGELPRGIQIPEQPGNS